MCSIIFGQRRSRGRSVLLVKRETLGKLLPYCLVNLIEQHILSTWYVPSLISEECTASKKGTRDVSSATDPRAGHWGFD